MKTVIIIPARYGSTRFPGKVLAPLAGKPIIEHVYNRACRCRLADAVYVAVDDQKVFDAVTAFGGKAIMTRPDHPSGSDRIFEAAQPLGADLIINVQGDEPLLPVESIDGLIEAMHTHSQYDMGTAAVRTTREAIGADPNKVKVVISDTNEALYFSRSCIPFLREGGTDTPLYLHWGLYAYRFAALERFVGLGPSTLENCEKLEQLRALQCGMRIYVHKLDHFHSIGIDTAEDLARAEAYVQTHGGLL